MWVFLWSPKDLKRSRLFLEVCEWFCCEKIGGFLFVSEQSWKPWCLGGCPVSRKKHIFFVDKQLGWGWYSPGIGKVGWNDGLLDETAMNTTPCFGHEQNSWIPSRISRPLCDWGDDTHDTYDTSNGLPHATSHDAGDARDDATSAHDAGAHATYQCPGSASFRVLWISVQLSIHEKDIQNVENCPISRTKFWNCILFASNF